MNLLQKALCVLHFHNWTITRGEDNNGKYEGRVCERCKAEYRLSIYMKNRCRSIGVSPDKYVYKPATRRSTHRHRWFMIEVKANRPMLIFFSQSFVKSIDRSAPKLVDSLHASLQSALSHEFHFLNECPEDAVVKGEVCNALYNATLDFLEERDETEGKTVYHEVGNSLEVHVVTKPDTVILCLDLGPNNVNDVYYHYLNFTIH